MKFSEVMFPLVEKERRALYARLADMGARVFRVASPALWRELTDEEILAVAGEQSRFDYRLLYVLVALVADRLERFHPFRLREAVKAMRTPAVWGVVSEFARKVRKDGDLEEFFKIVLAGVPPAPPQLFYNTLRMPRPEKDAAIVAGTPDEFLRWGFYATDPPLLKELELREKPKRFSKQSRRRILRQLFRKQRRVGVGEYLKAIDHSISRQQAHRDLVTFPGVRKISDRRGRRYLGA